MKSFVTDEKRVQQLLANLQCVDRVRKISQEKYVS